MYLFFFYCYNYWQTWEDSNLMASVLLPFLQQFISKLYLLSCRKQHVWKTYLQRDHGNDLDRIDRTVHNRLHITRRGVQRHSDMIRNLLCSILENDVLGTSYLTNILRYRWCRYMCFNRTYILFYMCMYIMCIIYVCDYMQYIKINNQICWDILIHEIHWSYTGWSSQIHKCISIREY